MFCQKCGANLSDEAKFCDKCGANTSGEGKNQTKNEKIEDNQVVLQVKSTYKILYASFGYIVSFVILLLFVFLPISVAAETFAVIIGYIVVYAIIWLVGVVINKKQFSCYEYNFYKTKIIYKDSFLNVSEKEVKYKHVREITFTQTFIQRFFHIGTIILYTNAESGFNNGILIRSVEDVKEKYEEIKKIVNI